MASKKLILVTLEQMTRSDLQEFFWFLHLNDPEIAPSVPTDMKPSEITDLLVSAYTEDDALSETVEILREMGRHVQAERLVMEAQGKSFLSDSSVKEHFVDKHKDMLIFRMRYNAPLLDELLIQGVIQEESYDKISSLPTRMDQMRELFNCLRDAGVEGKVAFFDIIEKLDPDLLKNIGKKAVPQGASAAPRSLKDLDVIRKKMTMVTTSPKSLNDDWIKLEPEVTSVNTYSLQSEAGNFECSISGLRWVCKKKVSLRYQFGSWEKHTERLETMQYVPGGPLLDITVISGKLDEVYLPHWVCTKDNPAILGKFAVLHIDTCGDVVEQADKVTPSHVKLSHPAFSPRAVLVRAGLPLKIYCKVLICKTNKSFLTLHVYVIPRDPALQEAIKKTGTYTMIEKPYPQRALKMRSHFVLTANKDNAKIYPLDFKLTYQSSDPNYFEVYIKTPDSDFKLTLTHESTTVWDCEIRKDDYDSPGDIQVTCGAVAGAGAGAGAASASASANPSSIHPNSSQSSAEGEEVGELTRVRAKLVRGLSMEVVNQLVDDLLEDYTLNDGEKESIVQGNNTRADRARCLIDTVMGKGHNAIRKTFTHLHHRDPTLSAELHLPFQPV